MKKNSSSVDGLQNEDTSDDEFTAHIDKVRLLLADKSQRPKVSRFLAGRNMAIAFANTAAFLYERDLKKAPHTRPHSIVPFVVNSAFAIELFLKALHEKYGSAKRGHKLLVLYDQLPSDAIARIRVASAAIAASTSPPVFYDARQVLVSLNSAFEDWRYLYEKDQLGPIYMQPTINVQKVLFEACRGE